MTDTCDVALRRRAQSCEICCAINGIPACNTSDGHSSVLRTPTANNDHPIYLLLQLLLALVVGFCSAFVVGVDDDR